MSKEKVIDISTRKTGKIVGICAAAVAAIIVVVSSVSIVPAGCTGVVTTFGKVSDTALNEGLHLKVPFAQRVTTVSNKIQVYQADADAVSKDLQTVNSTIAVNFRIKSASSASIFKNIGSDYENVILMPTVQECMKSVCAKYTAEQLITDRAQVGEEIKAQLVSKVDEYGIEIEAKQVAEQNLLKTKTEQEQAIVVAEAEAKKKVIAADAEATSIKTKAEAQAEANKTISESLSNELIKYQTIDKWDGVLPKVANDANPLISLDLDEQKTAE